MQVLVVDDSETMRTLIVRTLHAIGVVDVVEAADGKAALDLFRLGTPDIVLTDWIMPEMDGLQFTLELRSRGVTVPIVMITTEVKADQVNAAMQAGCDDYITQPVDADFLREKLHKHVSNSWNGMLRHNANCASLPIPNSVSGSPLKAD